MVWGIHVDDRWDKRQPSRSDLAVKVDANSKLGQAPIQDCRYEYKAETSLLTGGWLAVTKCVIDRPILGCRWR